MYEIKPCTLPAIIWGYQIRSNELNDTESLELFIVYSWRIDLFTCFYD